MRSLSVAATGMMAQQLHVEVISNNIANMTTTGYKRRRPEFQDLLYQSQRRIGATSSSEGTIVPAGVQLGLGVKTAAVYRIPEQGDFVNTENSFDLAIQGERLLRRRAAQRRARLHPLRQLPAQPRGPAGDAGRLYGQPRHHGAAGRDRGVDQPGGPGVRQDRGPGRAAGARPAELATFVNEAGLEAIGSNLLLETAASGPALAGPPGTDGLGTVLQGLLESSNVNPVQEITALITAQRAYDMNSKVIIRVGRDDGHRHAAALARIMRALLPGRLAALPSGRGIGGGGRARSRLAPGEPLTPQLVAELVRGDLVAQRSGRRADGGGAGAGGPAAQSGCDAAARRPWPICATSPNPAASRRACRPACDPARPSTLPTSGRVDRAGRGRGAGPGRSLAARRSASRMSPGSGSRQPRCVPTRCGGRRTWSACRRPAPLAAGRPARAGDVSAPWLVRRGEPASMRFTRGGLEIWVPASPWIRGGGAKRSGCRTPAAARCAVPSWSGRARSRSDSRGVDTMKLHDRLRAAWLLAILPSLAGCNVAGPAGAGRPAAGPVADRESGRRRPAIGRFRCRCPSPSRCRAPAPTRCGARVRRASSATSARAASATC